MTNLFHWSTDQKFTKPRILLVSSSPCEELFSSLAEECSPQATPKGSTAHLRSHINSWLVFPPCHHCSIQPKGPRNNPVNHSDSWWFLSKHRTPSWTGNRGLKPFTPLSRNPYMEEEIKPRSLVFVNYSCTSARDPHHPLLYGLVGEFIKEASFSSQQSYVLCNYKIIKGSLSAIFPGPHKLNF